MCPHRRKTHAEQMSLQATKTGPDAQAAKILGLSRFGLQKMMKRLSI